MSNETLNTIKLPAPRKKLGQHFLHDPRICTRIISAFNIRPEDHFVEIGPGRGALTIPLLRTLGKLTSIEFDRNLIPYLQERCSSLGELQLFHADALHFDFTTLAGPLRLVGNLPYNIATELLFYILDQPGADILDMHFMVQREVADRITACPRDSAYSRLSVMVQYRCQVERLFIVGAGAFYPAPKVESALIRICPYTTPPVAVHNPHAFDIVVRLAFAQRRKTIKNTLRTLISETAIRNAGIDPSARPETLSIAQFAQLSAGLSGRWCDNIKGC